MIEATGLWKSYGAVEVLRGVDLDLPAGGVLALSARTARARRRRPDPVDVIRPTRAGRGGGARRRRDRRRVRVISLTGQDAAVDELQTGEENLRMRRGLAGLDGRRAGHARASCSRGSAWRRPRRRRVGPTRAACGAGWTWPSGSWRRPSVSSSTSRRPASIPRSRQASGRPSASFATRGVTVCSTTQYLEEADRLADRIAVLDRGRIVAEGTAADLKRRVAEKRLEPRAARRPHRSKLPADRRQRRARPRALLDDLDPDRDAVERFAVREATLDDVFLALTRCLTR